MKKLYLVLVSSLIGVTALSAAPGETIAPFLEITGSSRQDAMGGAYTAMAEADSNHVNPGGLARLRGLNIAASYFTMLETDRHIRAFAAADLFFGVVGAHVSYTGSGAIEETSFNSAGRLEKNGSSFQVSGKTAGASYAMLLPFGLGVGATAKVIQADYAEPALVAVAGDLGAQMQLAGDRLFLGASALNLGVPHERNDGSGLSDSLPITVRAGLGFAIMKSLNHDVLVLVDGFQTGEEGTGVGVGGEYLFRRFLALRGGYMPLSNDQSYTFGAGVVTTLGSNKFHIDYGLQNNQEFGLTHRFTLRMRFGVGANEGAANASKKSKEKGLTIAKRKSSK